MMMYPQRKLFPISDVRHVGEELHVNSANDSPIIINLPGYRL